MYIYNASPYIINCTITRNIAINGGGLYVRYKPAPIFYNCILWGNTPNEVKKYPVNTVSPIITYSIVQGGFAGRGNINKDPLFISYGDYYHLTKESPGIDKGTSKKVPETDIDGDTRPAGRRIDIGADEYTGG